MFEQYLISDDPEIRSRANAWQAAINSEAVSPWFIRLAERHIRGEITLDEFDDLLEAHWSEIDYIIENGGTTPS